MVFEDLRFKSTGRKKFLPLGVCRRNPNPRHYPEFPEGLYKIHAADYRRRSSREFHLGDQLRLRKDAVLAFKRNDRCPGLQRVERVFQVSDVLFRETRSDGADIDPIVSAQGGSRLPIPRRATRKARSRRASTSRDRCPQMLATTRSMMRSRSGGWLNTAIRCWPA